MALNPSGQISIGGPTVGQSINLELNLSATANSSLDQADFRALAGIPSGTISLSNFYGKSLGTQKAMFIFGSNSLLNPATARTNSASYNIISSTGTVGATGTAPATGRTQGAGAGYGGDKGIAGWGYISPANTYPSDTVLISNTGVVGSAVAFSGTPRRTVGATGTGTDIAVVVYGTGPANVYLASQNNISNTGVVSGNIASAGTARALSGAVRYGGDKAIVAYGSVSGPSPGALRNVINLISNTGVVASDTTGSGTARQSVITTPYGATKGMFTAGNTPAIQNIYNTVSDTGVVSTDIAFPAGVTVKGYGAQYGGDKGILSLISYSNLVSNVGVIGTDTAVNPAIRLGSSGGSVPFSLTP